MKQSSIKVKEAPMKSFIVLTLFINLLFLNNVDASEKYPSWKPKLVLVLVYDQFRADYLTRFKDQFLPTKQNGFRFLMDQSAYFPFAEYETLQCTTCPGHASILSGSYPYSNGIPLNDWMDSKTGKSIYCAEDSEFKLSPRSLHATTVGDELRMISPQSKVIGVALKDRSAIMLGGHAADFSIWFSSEKMQWETSDYYLSRGAKLDWLKTYNEPIQKMKDKNIEWTATFSKNHFTKKMKADSLDAVGSPFGGELTTKLALKVMSQYKLGTRRHTDLLAISFSNHDVGGHKYGPNSPEMEELTLAEDRHLSELLTGIGKTVPGGLSNVVIILTADHGVAPTVEHAKLFGLDAGRINNDDVVTKLNQALTDRFGKPTKGNWVVGARTFNFYLNTEVFNTKTDKSAQIEAYAKEVLLEQSGVAYAMTRSEYLQNKLPPELFQKQILKSYIPGLSGDLILIPKPYWYETSKMPAIHMTGYTYDRTVPLLFLGKPFKTGVYSQTAKIVDLAPTLSFILGLVPPALSEGKVLSEALRP